MIDPKAIQKAMMLAKSVGRDIGLGRKDVLDRPRRADGGYLPPGHPEREANLARYMKGANKQVFNKDKSPKTFYHGTTVPEDFSEFSVGNPIHTEDEYGESHRRIYTHNDPTTYLGSHFAEEPEIANKFGKGLYGEAKGAQEGNRVLPVHLSIKKPHVTTETDMIRSMLRDTYDHPAVSARLQNEEEEKRYNNPNEIDFRTRVNKFAWKLSSDESAYDNDTFAEQMAEQYRNRLINAGFDGIKYQNEVEGGNSWVAFHPTQIKSAVGNNGQYDPNEPEIDKAEGGEVDTDRNAAFKGLASAQRGDPEMAMVKAQVSLGKLKKSGTSVLSSLLEHVGDLTHRISQYPASQPSLALENAPPKIKKALMALRPYTRDRMDLEDHVPSDMPELKEYADAHAALPAYNDMQRHARDAAVALGNKDFNAANAHLTKLHDAISDGSFGNRIMEFNSPITKAEGGTVLSGGFTGPSAIASAPAQRISIPALPTMQSVIGGNSFQMYAPTVASRPDYDHSSVFAPVAAAPSAALQRQYPTATADQLNEYERAIAGGGDPKATRSLMQAYGPASGVKELQPWSSEFKGFDYARSRPVDDFGNPIGWSAPDRTPPTTGADGVPSGWDARDWENMKNFDPGSPSDEYILNNPWTYGMDSLGNPGPLTLGYPSQRAEERSSTGPGIAEAKALYQSNKNVESQRQAAMAANAAAGTDPGEYVGNSPDGFVPMADTGRYFAPWANQPAAQPAAGQTAPKSSWSSLPSNFSLGNLGQMGASILGMTPLGIPITLANSILTGTNTIPQAQTTGSRVLDQAATQGPITNFLAKNVVNPVSQFFGGSPMPKAVGGSINPDKDIRKAMMLAKMVAEGIGLGKLDVLDRPDGYASGGSVGYADGGDVGGLEFPEEESAFRLRTKLNREQKIASGKPDVGLPKNSRTVVRAPQNSGLPDFVAGNINFDDWKKRHENILNPEEIKNASEWYRNVYANFNKYAGGDTEKAKKYMRAWLVAQQNVSPAGAMNNVLLQSEQMARRVPEHLWRAAGMPNPTEAARSVLQQEPITGGVGQKIADFVDSAEGKNVRSLMGNKPEGGEPFVVDVHTARDTGMVDEELINHLSRLGYNKNDLKKLTIDLKGTPTEAAYENRSNWGRNLTNHLNKVGWMGRKDWIPADVQAVGWMGMTKLTRNAEEDSESGLGRNLRRISYEAAPGEGSPWETKYGDALSALGDEHKRSINQKITESAMRHASELAGIDINHLVHGTGAWEKYQNPSTVAHALATEHAADIAAHTLGYLLNQTEVWHNRIKPITQNPKGFAVDFIEHGSNHLSDPKNLEDFWNKVMEADSSGLIKGYQPIRQPTGEVGIRALIDRGGAGTKKKIDDALQQGGSLDTMLSALPFKVHTTGSEAEISKARNDWKEYPNGQSYLERLGDLLGSNPTSHLDYTRSQLEKEFEQHLDEAHAAQGTSWRQAQEQQPQEQIAPPEPFQAMRSFGGRINKNNGGYASGGSVGYAGGGYIDPDPEKSIRRAMMLAGNTKSGAMLPASVYSHAQRKPGRR